MSKSLGNFFTVHDLLEQGVPGEVIRFVFLGTHYRKPMDWTEKKRAEAEKIIFGWLAQYSDFEAGDPDQEVIDAIADDLNTPKALARLHQLAKTGEYPALLASLNLLGFEKPSAERMAMIGASRLGGFLDQIVESNLRTLEQKLHETRVAAMETKDFSSVDALKTALTDAGVQVRMSKDRVELEPGPGFDPSKLEDL